MIQTTLCLKVSLLFVGDTSSRGLCGFHFEKLIVSKFGLFNESQHCNQGSQFFNLTLIQHFTSTLVMMLHLRPLRLNGVGMEQR